MGVGDELGETATGGGTLPRAGESLGAGDQFGRYVVERMLGAGGMGVVYAVHDPDLDRSIAVKVLRDNASGESRVRLLREARAMAKVRHANVVTVHEVGTTGGVDFIAMELIEGGTLADWLQGGRRTRREVLRVFGAAGRGLAAAHARGLVHRDFKPRNVLLGPGGEVLVTDFGLVHRYEPDAPATAAHARAPADANATVVDDLTLTRAGAVLGTPAYMAPERFAGEIAGPGADQFSFAVALWEGLAGERPFRGTTLGEMSAAVSQSPVNPSTLPRRLRPILLRALARAPRDRWPDLPAMLDAIDRAERRTRRLAMAGVLALAAAVIAAVVIATRTPPAAPAWHAVIEELHPGFEDNGDHERISPDGTRVAFDSDRDPGGGWRVYVRSLDGTGERAVTPPETSAGLVNWTPEGAILIWQETHPGTIFQVDATGGAPKRIAEAQEATSCGEGLLLYRHEPLGSDCTPCGRLIIRGPDGREQPVARLEGTVFGFRCDRRGGRVVYNVSESRARAEVWLLDLSNGGRRQLTRDGGSNMGPVFTPDRDSIVFSSVRGGRRNLWELPLTGGDAVQLTVGDGDDFVGDITPDGRLLIFAADVTTTSLWARPAAGGPLRRVSPHRLMLSDLQATPDGQEVIATDLNRIVAIRISDGSVRELAKGMAASVSPDGREVVVASEGAPARLAAVPLHGDRAPRGLGTLDGAVVLLRVGEDGVVHAGVQRAGSFEAWQVPLAGGAPVRDAPAPWCFVQPAPTGGVAIWIRCDHDVGAMYPDHPTSGVLSRDRPDPSEAGFGMAALGEFDATGAVYVYIDPRGVVQQLDVASRVTTPLSPPEAQWRSTLSPDGKTVFVAYTTARHRRYVMTNFAERPRVARRAR